MLVPPGEELTTTTKQQTSEEGVAWASRLFLCDSPEMHAVTTESREGIIDLGAVGLSLLLYLLCAQQAAASLPLQGQRTQATEGHSLAFHM